MMAEFHFYATRTDRLSMLRELARVEGLTWFRSGTYLAPVPQILDEGTLEEIVASGERQFYGLPASSGALPEMCVIVAGSAAGSWYIDVNDSPQMVVCNLPPHYEEGGWRLGVGNIYFPASGHMPDPEMRRRFRVVHANVVRLLKRTHLRSKVVAGKRVWITTAALDALEGGALLLIDGKWVDGGARTGRAPLQG
jgi:hypothetical protein